jgi:DNA-binding HxlR family transcriptional regulator
VERKRFDQQPCPIARSVDLLGDWWIPLILREAMYGAEHFSVFQERLDISKNILTQRLERMLAEGLLERRLYQEKPPRSSYHLTDKGRSALKILAAMVSWADRWVFAAGEHPIELWDKGQGRRVIPTVVDSQTGQELKMEDLEIRPGPGFPQEALAFRFSQLHAPS